MQESNRKGDLKTWGGPEYQLSQNLEVELKRDNCCGTRPC